MNLYILRHASAGTRRPNPLLDIKRPLDKEGKQHCLQLAYVLNALNISFDLILSSPLKRSLQTAQLIATETGFEAEIEHSAALAPEATFAAFQKLLLKTSERGNASDDTLLRENVLFVGHNPNLQSFLGELLAPDQPPARAPQIRLRKGSLARLSFLRGAATLQNLLDARTVRALYATSTKSSRRKTSRK